ncbi:MAG: M23 family metallopeptidase, partial [Rickettsiales bacterium]
IENRFKSLKIKVSQDREIEIYKNESNDFDIKNIIISFNKNLIRVKGKINSNFLSTANSLDIPIKALKEMVQAYSYDVDFQRDIQAGDEIDVFYEKFYRENGEFSHNGSIVYSSLLLSDRKLELYRYKDKDGKIQYYNGNGLSICKELLKTPINIVKISSGFGLRKHPILGYTKMHKGVDFAAPIGTPILAAGDGTIEEIGRKGNYGNYIRIKHKGGYATAYAHASSFNRNLRKGSSVKQGEVIAYVGNTGMSKGAHLHFETIIDGKQVNPIKVKMSSNTKLVSNELTEFNKHKYRIALLLNNTSNYAEVKF